MCKVRGAMAWRGEKRKLRSRHRNFSNFRRRESTRQSAGREDGAQAETHPPPGARGHQGPGQRRGAAAGNRPDLQRQPQHDFTPMTEPVTTTTGVLAAIAGRLKEWPL